MPYVVVIFGSSAGGWCDLNRCPMETIGPFTTHDKAVREAATYPDAFQPHVLVLREPGGEAPVRAVHPAWHRSHQDGEHPIIDHPGWDAADEYPWQSKLTEEETCD